MNVILELPDDLRRKAEHLAVKEHKSLVAWTKELINREIAKSGCPTKRSSLFELFGHPLTEDLDFPLEDRKAHQTREFSFYD